MTFPPVVLSVHLPLKTKKHVPGPQNDRGQPSGTSFGTSCVDVSPPRSTIRACLPVAWGIDQSVSKGWNMTETI